MEASSRWADGTGTWDSGILGVNPALCKKVAGIPFCLAQLNLSMSWKGGCKRKVLPERAGLNNLGNST
jgi:hypothetical protein